MAERFPSDAAAADGFGRRTLQEGEAWLLFEANIPAPPDMRVGPTGGKLSNNGVPIPLVSDVDARLGILAAEVDRVRSSLTEEQRALPQYATDNHAAWTDYFQRRQAQRLASTNGAPVVGGIKNSGGRRVWWGVLGRTLHEVMAHLEGGNNPPLAYPVAAAVGAQEALFGVKAEPAAETPLGRRTRSAGIVINEGGRRASSSVPPCFVKPKMESGLPVVKTEPGLASGVKEEALDDEAALKWACDDWAQTEMERQCAAFAWFKACRRGRDEGGIIVLDDYDDDDDAPPPPARHEDAGQGSSRGGRAIKK